MVQDKINFINKTLFKRLITLSFLFPVFIYCILINNFFSKFIILLTAIILSYEWFNMTQKKNMLNLIFFKFLIFINLYISINLSFTSSLVTTIFFSFFLFLLTQIKKKINKDEILYLFYGYILICIPFLIFFKIKSNVNGEYILLWLLIIISSTDISAYFFGSLFKGPKIFPGISPSKTFSGTIIGILIGSLFGIIFYMNYLTINNNYSLIFLFSFLLAIAGFFGDIFMSKIKRNFNKKDSSNFLPGHGGFLDRYDSFSFALILLFFIDFFIK